MKTIKQLTIIILFAGFITNLNAQEKVKVRADTIRIKFEKCMLEVATFDLKLYTLQKAEIKEKINLLLAEIKKIEFNSPENNNRVWIKYSIKNNEDELGWSNLTMSWEENRSKKMVVKDGELLETDFGNLLLEVEDKDYLIRLHLKKLSDADYVNSSEFANKLITADSEIPENRKKTNGWLVENENNTFNKYLLGEVPPLTLDLLELNAGVGTGWIHNQFVSGFNFRVGFAFAKKGIMKNKYFAEYEVLYDFSQPTGSKKFQTNGFLSLGFARNFSLDPNNASWYGISAGYLLDRGNDFFEKNTFKIAVHKQISNSITLQPEIYFSDFNKSGSPALRVQITF